MVTDKDSQAHVSSNNRLLLSAELCHTAPDEHTVSEMVPAGGFTIYLKLTLTG